MQIGTPLAMGVAHGGGIGVAGSGPGAGAGGAAACCIGTGPRPRHFIEQNSPGFPLNVGLPHPGRMQIGTPLAMGVAHGRGIGVAGSGCACCWQP